MKGRKAPAHLRCSRDSSSAEKMFSSSPHERGMGGGGMGLRGIGAAKGSSPQRKPQRFWQSRVHGCGIYLERARRRWKSTGDIFLLKSSIKQTKIHQLLYIIIFNHLACLAPKANLLDVSREAWTRAVCVPGRQTLVLRSKPYFCPPQPAAQRPPSRGRVEARPELPPRLSQGSGGSAGPVPAFCRHSPGAGGKVCARSAPSLTSAPWAIPSPGRFSRRAGLPGSWLS